MILQILKNIVFYPFLLAVYPVLFLFSINFNKMPFNAIIQPFFFILITTVIIFTVVNYFIKDIHKTGLILTVCLVLFFTSGIMFNIVFWQIIDNDIFVAIVFILMITGSVFIAKKISFSSNFTQPLNVIASILIIFCIINIFINIFNTNNTAKNVNDINKQPANKIASNIHSSEYPDIYYIILDAYASSITLKKYYNYNNSRFMNYLKDKGFYVVSKPRSNYSWTTPSLGSSLNFEHVNNKNEEKISELRANNKLTKYLKSKGYKYINIESQAKNKSDEFFLNLINMTVLGPVAYKIPILSDPNRNQILRCFSELDKAAYIKGNKFIFFHIMCPHPPYLFDKNGKPAKIKSLSVTDWGENERYLEQLIFITKKTRNSINSILAKSKEPPVIILQSDHGPSTATNLHPDWPTNPTTDMLTERMTILNAYYFPDYDYSSLYNSITPVNSFRVVLNKYFGTNYDFLEDNNYYSTMKKPFTFINVTDKFKTFLNSKQEETSQNQ